MLIDPSDNSIVHIGPSRSATILQLEGFLQCLFSLLIDNELHEKNTLLDLLDRSVIALGGFLIYHECCWPEPTNRLGIVLDNTTECRRNKKCWPKPTDRLGIVFVETLELGEKLWPLREYLFPCTEKQDQIVDEFAREIYLERAALAEDSERESIETEYGLLLAKLHYQLGAITLFTETKLREMQSRGSEIICEMIDPCSTDRNCAEPNPPKLPKVQPSLTNPIVTGDSLAPPVVAAGKPTAEPVAPAGETEQLPVVATPSAIPPAVPTEKPFATPVAFAGKRKKRSTTKGEGRTKLLSALALHHKYSQSGCLNLEPIGCNEIANLIVVSGSTASLFFELNFGDHLGYVATCRDAKKLFEKLKSLYDEFADPSYGSEPM